uniref:Uncharacterized protein n=1 Tax=Cacopsylla melanoneura TaxID=428564 RepID=A0A8D8RLB8_9HEMI
MWRHRPEEHTSPLKTLGPPRQYPPIVINTYALTILTRACLRSRSMNKSMALPVDRGAAPYSVNSLLYRPSRQADCTLSANCTVGLDLSLPLSEASVMVMSIVSLVKI